MHRHALRRAWKARESLPCTCQLVPRRRYSAQPAFKSSADEHHASVSAAPNHEALRLKSAFDEPVTPSRTRTRSTGIFDQLLLQSADSFLPLARSTTQRAELIVKRICKQRPAPMSLEGAEREFLLLVKQLDRLSDLLCGVIDMLEVVRNVHPDATWERRANEAYETLCEFMNVLNVHQGLYQALKTAYERLPPTTFTKSKELFAAQAVAIPFLRDFEKSGIHLPDQQRQSFVDLSSQVISLGRQILQNAAEPREPVLLPRPDLESFFGAASVAEAYGSADKLPIDPNSYEGKALARYHPSSDVRRALFEAAPPRSHVKTLEELFDTRLALARLVGRPSWADVALEDKMARTPDAVNQFLAALQSANSAAADEDVRSLHRFKQSYERGKLEAWDRDYFANLSTPSLPDLSPFFSLGTIFSGLSTLFSRLYGVTFELDSVSEGEVWHPTVRKLRVVDERDGVIGHIYCDLFAREGKQPGAAHYTVRCSRRLDDDDAAGDVETEHDGLVASQPGMAVDPIVWQSRKGKHQSPIIVLVCAFEARDEGKACLQFHEAETLYHEMGHAMHSMIGRTTYHNVSGTRCATDFVELPSVLMESFFSSPSLLRSLSCHLKTGRAIPDDLIDNVLRTRRQFKSIENASQISMALLDQAYHSPSTEPFDSERILRNVNASMGSQALALPPGWQTTFTHLVGYGATYYSYLFDRAIASHVYATLFDETRRHANDRGRGPFDREAGEKLKEMLSWGGGKEPWECVADLLDDERLAKGGKEAMRIVGQWGIEA